MEVKSKEEAELYEVEKTSITTLLYLQTNLIYQKRSLEEAIRVSKNPEDAEEAVVLLRQVKRLLERVNERLWD